LDFENADIHSVIRIFAEVSGRNFILDESVKGRVTVRLQDVPWDQALAAILLSQGLGWTSMSNPYATSLQQGRIFVVAPMGK
jgi:type IV pilus assembly protein PilQ